MDILGQLPLPLDDRRDPEEWLKLPGPRPRWVKRWVRVRRITQLFGWDRFKVYDLVHQGVLKGRKGSGRNCHLFIDLKSAWAHREKEL